MYLKLEREGEDPGGFLGTKRQRGRGCVRGKRSEHSDAWVFKVGKPNS